MGTSPLKLAIVYPGDSEVRRLATAQNNRHASLFAAFAERGVDARPAVYNRAQTKELSDQLRSLDGALVWVNPIESGESRAPLDAVLREAAAAGVFVSTHPDVIMKLGTKDVLVDTREMGWGSDVHRIDTLAQLRDEVGRRLQSGAARVLKQWRGHSGIGVWRVERLENDLPLEPTSLVRLRHAQRGSTQAEVTFDQFVAQMAPYFNDGGHMVDQAWQPRMTEGMVRCYVVQDQVAGFGIQAVNALSPVPAGSPPDAAPAPTARLYHPPRLPHLQRLKRRLEVEWVPELRRRLAISHEELPMLWDCDFLPGEASASAEEAFVLCEINVSSVAPFPESAIAPLVEATVMRLEENRSRRSIGAS
jgi:hypothetical protein